MSSKFWRWVRAGRGVRRPAPAARRQGPAGPAAGGRGAWSDPANWAGGVRPDSAEAVVLAAGAAALPDTEAEARS
jgi:hypothetical protein